MATAAEAMAEATVAEAMVAATRATAAEAMVAVTVAEAMVAVTKATAAEAMVAATRTTAAEAMVVATRVMAAATRATIATVHSTPSIWLHLFPHAPAVHRLGLVDLCAVGTSAGQQLIAWRGPGDSAEP